MIIVFSGAGTPRHVSATSKDADSKGAVHRIIAQWPPKALHIATTTNLCIETSPRPGRIQAQPQRVHKKISPAGDDFSAAKLEAEKPEFLI